MGRSGRVKGSRKGVCRHMTGWHHTEISLYTPSSRRAALLLLFATSLRKDHSRPSHHARQLGKKGARTTAAAFWVTTLSGYLTDLLLCFAVSPRAVHFSGPGVSGYYNKIIVTAGH